MKVICLQDDAFYTLIDKVVEHLKESRGNKDKWLSTEQAMERLLIKSKTTLQKLRDEGAFDFPIPKRNGFYTMQNRLTIIWKNTHETHFKNTKG
jgi:hypothetical protein